MSLQDLFYLILTAACIVFIVSVSLLTFFMINLLKSIRRFVDKIDDTTKGVRMIKDNLKIWALSVLSILFNIWTKKRR